MSYYKVLIGMPLLKAVKSYPRETIREVLRDGKAQPLSTDLKIARINVETKNGIIIAIDGWY